MRLEKNSCRMKDLKTVQLYRGEGCAGAYITSGDNCNYGGTGGGCNTSSGTGGNCKKK